MPVSMRANDRFARIDSGETLLRMPSRASSICHLRRMELLQQRLQFCRALLQLPTEVNGMCRASFSLGAENADCVEPHRTVSDGDGVWLNTG